MVTPRARSRDAGVLPERAAGKHRIADVQVVRFGARLAVDGACRQGDTCHVRTLLLTLALPVMLAACGLEPAAEASPPTAHVQSPRIPLTGRVTDAAGVIPSDRAEAISAKLAELERVTQHQLVMVTVPSLDGEDISAFSLRLARSWGIGRKGYDDGVVLLVAPRERKVRIEVGYGLEKALPDDLCKAILQRNVLPRFRSNDLPGGIEAGVDALIVRLK